MAQAANVSAAPLAGLQTCDWSDLTIDNATEPKKGGTGNLRPYCARVLRVAALTVLPAGQVLRAFLKGIEVAVKRPMLELTLNPRDDREFKREVTMQAKVLACPAPMLPRDRRAASEPLFLQVCHPNCVQIISASSKPPFIVMEWVPGGCWFDALGCDPAPPAYQRIRAARETAGALDYLHDALIGVIHGDIKSLNVLRASDGSSKVLCNPAYFPSQLTLAFRCAISAAQFKCSPLLQLPPPAAPKCKPRGRGQLQSCLLAAKSRLLPTCIASGYSCGS